MCTHVIAIPLIPNPFLITHTSLAIYSRSPAALEAVRNLGIIQLPGRSSLQAFISNERNDRHVYEKQIAAQLQLYEHYKKDQVANGHLQPQGFGILIFDEVRVQGKVVWNSKNNQIIGVAMTLHDLPSLQDIYTSLNDDQNIQETWYILQFVWCDLTGRFDVVGPHYSSSDGFDAKVTIACLFDAMLLFETYNFNGASCIIQEAYWSQWQIWSESYFRQRQAQCSCIVYQPIHRMAYLVHCLYIT